MTTLTEYAYTVGGAMNRGRIFITSLVISLSLGINHAIAKQGIAFSLLSGVRVQIVEAPFDKALFKISGCGENDQSCLINGQVPFGTDLGFPNTYTKSITVSYQKQSYSLDVSNMYNAWGNRPLEVKGDVRYFGGKCFYAKNCHFRGLFSDGAGTFVAEWHIVNGTQIRTILTNTNDVVNLFMRHIDPPEYE
jgi:hypothetical protein